MTNEIGLRVIHLEAENYMGLRALAFDPDRNVVVISGENGSGKSSVLSAIEAALVGPKGTPEMPVRTGHAEARVHVVLGDDGRPAYKVTREFRRGGESRLLLEDASGAKCPKPQSILDGFLGLLAFNPFEFAEPRGAKATEAARRQVEMLLRVCPVVIDLDDNAARRKDAFERRTTQNTILKERDARLSAMPLENDPGADDDLGAIRERGAAARRVAEAAVAAQRARDAAVFAVKSAEAAVAEARTVLEAREKALTDARARLDGLPAPDGEAPDVAAIEEEYRAALGRNAQKQAVRQRIADRRALADARSAAARSADALTQEIEGLDRARSDALAAAKFPVDGLGIDEAGVTIRTADGPIPFAQANKAKRLEVSMAIVASLRPRCRVMHVPDGNDLDEKSLQALYAFAKERDLQVWIERVAADQPGSVVIEDGKLAAPEAAS